MTAEIKSGSGAIGRGVLIGFGLNFLHIAIVLGVLYGVDYFISATFFQHHEALQADLILSLFLIAFAQGIYVVPAFIWFTVRRRPRTAVGLMIAAAITALLDFVGYLELTSRINK